MATPYMGLDLPIPNVTSGTWGTMLNTAFTAIDQHDHSTGKGQTTLRPEKVEVTVGVESTVIDPNSIGFTNEWLFYGVSQTIAQPALKVTPQNGIYPTLYRNPGDWSDSHNIHIEAIGGMNPSPDPRVFVFGPGGTGDYISIDWHTNDVLGNLIDPKPIIYAQNIDNVNARITMADKHNVETESALIRLGKGQVDLEAIDPAWWQTFATRGAPYFLRLDGVNRSMELFDNTQARATWGPHLDLWSNYDYDTANITGYNSIDIQGYKDSVTPGVVGNGFRYRIRANDDAGNITSIGGYAAIWTNVGSGTYASKARISVARAGMDIDTGNEAALEFEGADLAIRIYDGATLMQELKHDGITLRSPDNTLWRITIDNAGNLVTTVV